MRSPPKRGRQNRCAMVMAPSDGALIAEGQGRLAENLTHFGRALRKAGLRVGPRDILAAVEALSVGGIGEKQDVYWSLHAVFVKKHQDSEIFDQAFQIFFRKRGHMERLMQLLVPPAPKQAKPEKGPQANRRVSEAMFEQQQTPREAPPVIELDANMTVSDREVLRSKDFEQMSADEVARARRLIGEMILPFDARPTRRMVRDPHGTRVDMRASLRASMRTGGGLIDLKRKGPDIQPPPIVALCDVSGSMSDYTRMFLHFLHALKEKRKRVEAFVFATRLTNITRALAERDPDEALAKCGAGVEDWSGGTRLSTSLETFNKRWSRRVLGQGATVLLMTDGLEREHDTEALETAMDRLHRSCRTLIWLNPLLRYDAFEAKARGIRAMLPHVDSFCPIHNIQSMESLVRALDPARGPRGDDPKNWLRALNTDAA